MSHPSLMSRSWVQSWAFVNQVPWHFDLPCPGACAAWLAYMRERNPPDQLQHIRLNFVEIKIPPRPTSVVVVLPTKGPFYKGIRPVVPDPLVLFWFPFDGCHCRYYLTCLGSHGVKVLVPLSGETHLLTWSLRNARHSDAHSSFPFILLCR